MYVVADFQHGVHVVRLAYDFSGGAAEIVGTKVLCTSWWCLALESCQVCASTITLEVRWLCKIC